jgi:hypothetical protein
MFDALVGGHAARRFALGGLGGCQNDLPDVSALCECPDRSLENGLIVQRLLQLVPTESCRLTGGGKDDGETRGHAVLR